MDTVILQASVWNELQEVYYRSNVFKDFQSWDVVEPMLQAAREHGMTVFLGGYADVSGWSKLDDGAAAREIERQTACISELLKYRDLFAGIYYSPETAFHGKREPSREEALNRIYREYFTRVKMMAPEKKLLLSPASFFHPDAGPDFVASRLAALKDVPLDILAPQDSIGSGVCTLPDQAEMWRRRLAASQTGITLWANIELFKRAAYGGAAPFVSASPERILAQRSNVSPYVEKCVCWEALHFRP